jgi:HEAT repeat protein
MLGLPPLPRTLAAALRDIVDPKERVRLSAIRDLVRLTRVASERAAALSALGHALLRDSSAECRAEAAVALADADASESRDVLLAALEDQSLRVRQMTLLSLGEIANADDSEVITRVRSLLAAPEAALRFQALVALDALCPELAPAAIEAASGDSDDEVRTMAFRLAEARFPADVSAPAGLLEAAHAALERHAPLVRATAALFLAARGDGSGASVLLDLIDGRVRAASGEEVQAAIDAVVALKLESARRALVFRAFGIFGVRSDPIAWHACVALAKMGDERARAAILKGLDAWTHQARTFAVVAAGEAGIAEARSQIEAFRADPRRAAPEAVEAALRALSA